MQSCQGIIVRSAVLPGTGVGRRVSTAPASSIARSLAAPTLAANSSEVQEKFASVENLGQKSQSVACNVPPELHGCLTAKMQAPWRPSRSFPGGIPGTFNDYGCPGTCPTTCIRLKKMQAIACIKMGSFCQFLRNLQEIAYSPK